MILYEVDFTKKNKENEKQNDNPAEIITLKEPQDDLTECIIKACDLFNSGNLLQSAYYFNKAYDIDSLKDHSNLVDVSILGIINVKLSNFELAQKYLIKSLSLKMIPTIVMVLYHNSLYLKNFKLAKKLKSEFRDIIDFKNLCIVKNDTYLIYDEKYNFKKLFAELVEQLNIKKSSAILPLFDILKITDPSNPYLIQIQKDLIENIGRKYSLNFTSSLVKSRLNEIDIFLKSKDKNFTAIEMNGIVRFLFENCKLDKFESYITEFLKLNNLPLNFIWQCEDMLFNNYGEDKKLFLLQKLLIEKRYCMRSISVFLKDELFILKGVDEVRKLKELNGKLYNSFVFALIEVLKLNKLKQSNSFLVDIFMQRILKRIIVNLENGELRVERISSDKLKRCFFILLTNHMLNLRLDFKDEIKNLNPVFKKLGFDFDLLKKVASKDNLILVDFT